MKARLRGLDLPIERESVVTRKLAHLAELFSERGIPLGRSR
jgi:hypothetical protein